MQKPTVFLVASLLLLSFQNPLHPALIEDAWTGDIASATATIADFGSYTFNKDTAYNSDLAQGPLSFVADDDAFSWAYLPLISEDIELGSWTWSQNNVSSSYEASRQKWSMPKSLISWSYSDSNVFSSDTTGDTWSFNFVTVEGVKYLVWANTFTEDETSLGKSWSYNRETGGWQNSTDTLSWTLDLATRTWALSGTTETWTFDPRLETWTYTGPDAPTNRWKKTTRGTWVEEFSRSEWYFTPSAPGGGGQQQQGGGDPEPLHGTWTNYADPALVASYEAEAGQWFIGVDESHFFPRHLPPFLIIQATEMLHANKDFYDHFSLPYEPTATIIIADPDDDLVDMIDMDEGGFIFRRGSTNVGKGATFGFDADAEWQSTSGEKWTLLAEEDDGSTTYQNASSDIGVDADTINGSFALDSWHHPLSSSLAWIPNKVDRYWTCQALENTRIVFSKETDTWVQIKQDDSVISAWKYTKDLTHGWAWKDLTTGTLWKYLDNGGNPYWSEIASGRGWITEGANYKNIADDTTWIYSPTTYLWHEDGDEGTLGKKLFPGLPSTHIATIYAVTYEGNQSTHISSPRSTTSLASLAGDIAGYVSDAQAAETTLQTIESENTGAYLFAGAAGQRSAAFKKLCDTLFYTKRDFDFVMHPTNYDVLVRPTAEEYVWPTTRGQFATSNQCALSIKNDDATHTIKLAFAATQGIADVYLSIERSGRSIICTLTTPTTFLASESYGLSDDQIDRDNDNGYSQFWVTYKDGVFRLGLGNPSEFLNKPLAQNILLEHTITADDAPLDLDFFGFTNADGQAPSFRFRNYRYDVFGTMVNAFEAFNKTHDLLFIGKTENLFEGTKANLASYANHENAAADQSQLRSKTIKTLSEGEGFSGFRPDYYFVDGGFNSTLGSDASDLFSSANKDRFNNIRNAVIGTKGTLAQATDYASVVADIEAIFTRLLKADSVTLSTAERTALLDEARSDFDDAIAIAITNVSNLTFSATSLSDYTISADATAFINYYVEETQFMQNLGLVIGIVKDSFLSRFERQDLLYEESASALRTKQLALDLQQDLINSSAITTIAARLAAGETSLYAAVTSLSIVLALFNTFDEVKRQTETLLTSLGYSAIHAIPEGGSDLRNTTNATNALTTIMKSATETLRLAGNEFFDPNEGLASETEDQLDDVLLHEEKTSAATSTLPTQRSSVATGTAALPSRIGVLTEDDANNTSTVREVTVEGESKATSHARLYIKDAITALGNANLSPESGSSLSVLGSVQLSPEGNTTVLLSSDIRIEGNEAIRPTRKFGSPEGEARRCIPATRAEEIGKHQILFYSDVDRTITIASGAELDLTAFAKGTINQGQRIVFGGKTKLVLEAGAKIRLPYTTPAEKDYRLTLAFTDDAELIVQGPEKYEASRHTNAANGTELTKCKLLGVGLIELSGKASARIMRSAHLGIEADYTTSKTNVAILLKDNASWMIGDHNIAGGAMQIGNIMEGGYNARDLDSGHYPNNTNNPLYLDLDAPFEPHPTSVEFDLTINGSGAQFYMSREAFLGFGVGVVNKSGNPNGKIPSSDADPADDPAGQNYKAWELQPLRDVNNISLTLLSGKFSHHNVANGTSDEASVLAVGPLGPRGSYKLALSKEQKDIVFGGGNVVLWRKDNESALAEAAALPLSLWDAAAPLTGLAQDNGAVSLLAPAPVIALRQTIDRTDRSIRRFGRGGVQSSSSFYEFTGPQDEFFQVITMKGLSSDKNIVAAYKDGASNYVAFVDTNNTIQRYKIFSRDVLASSGEKNTALTIANRGYLFARDGADIPRIFSKPQI